MGKLKSTLSYMLNFQIKDYNMDCMSSKLLSLTGDNAGFAKNTCNACPDILRKDVIFWCLETKSTSSFDQATDLLNARYVRF